MKLITDGKYLQNDRKQGNKHQTNQKKKLILQILFDMSK